MAEAVKKEEPKKKGIFTKIKESVDDKEEQLAFLSTIVRLSVLVWSAGILTLAYVKLPAAFNIPEQKLDPTFIASVFTGTLACLLYTSPSPRDDGVSRMPSSA